MSVSIVFVLVELFLSSRRRKSRFQTARGAPHEFSVVYIFWFLAINVSFQSEVYSVSFPFQFGLNFTIQPIVVLFNFFNFAFLFLSHFRKVTFHLFFDVFLEIFRLDQLLSVADFSLTNCVVVALGECKLLLDITELKHGRRWLAKLLDVLRIFPVFLEFFNFVEMTLLCFIESSLALVYIELHLLRVSVFCFVQLFE